MQALSDSELLSILIGSGTMQHNAVEIGSMILSNFDRDLTKLSKADFRELKEVEGVGTYTACKILAAIELGRRKQFATMGLSPDLRSATANYNYMRPKMQDLKVEEAHVILMNQNLRLIKSIRLSQGGISEVSVDIRILLEGGHPKQCGRDSLGNQCLSKRSWIALRNSMRNYFRRTHVKIENYNN